MDKKLSYFMRPLAKEEQIVEMPGPETIKDENGKVVNLRIRKLSNEKIDKINMMYESKTYLKDKKGNFVVNNGQAVVKVEKDRAKAVRHIMVEALEYPDLKDPELMAYFGTNDITDMPYKVFPDNEEYAFVLRQIMKVLNLVDEEDTDDEIEDAKN